MMRFLTARAVRRVSRVIAWLPALIAAGIPGDCVSARGQAQPSAREEERKKLVEMQEIARGYRVSVLDGEGRGAPATIVAEPLHRWTDPTREFSGGALWTWRSAGRPVAVFGLELYGTAWSHEFVSLSGGRVVADNGQVHWAPSKGGVEFREVPDAPAPADAEAGRLRQMRDLARRFAAREFWDGRSYALRLLPHPIDRYSDPPSGLRDGAIFAYANGTNPELLLLLEARRRGDGDRPTGWWFAAARLGRAELTLKLGPRDVWTAPILRKGLVLNPEDPYYTTLTTRARPGR